LNLWFIFRTTPTPYLVCVILHAAYCSYFNSFGDNMKDPALRSGPPPSAFDESESSLLKLILENTSSLFLVLDTDLKIRLFNKESLEIVKNLTGKALKAGESVFNYVQEKHKTEIRKVLEEMLVGRTTHFDFHHEDSKQIFSVQCRPVPNTGKKIYAIIINAADITTGQQSLINSEKKFRALIEKSKDGFSVITIEGKVLDISPAGCDILGYTKENYIGQDAATLVHPDDRKRVNTLFESIISKPDNVGIIDYRFRKADGEYLWIESTFHNLLHEPAIEAVVIHFRDITERKRTEELLQASEEKYRNLFNNNPCSIFIWNPADLAILEINEAAIDEYGYTREEFLKMTVAQLGLSGAEHEIKNLALNILTSEHLKATGVWQHITKSGDRRYMEITFDSIDYFGKKASLAIVNNITEKIELERKLANERMRKQHEITAAVITAQERDRQELGKELHDNINQILATTRLYVEYAQTNEAMRHELLESAKQFIVTAVKEIRNLSKSLVPPSLGEIGLVTAVNELVSSIRELKKFEFSTDFGENLDESLISEQLKLTIFRIIQEQLANIIKHSDAKHILIKINMQNGRLILTVKDDGKGFNVLQQSSGVGLKNISSRADLHGGAMHVQSEPGMGCQLDVLFSL
jgi:PAS domain S-box-containing protein